MHFLCGADDGYQDDDHDHAEFYTEREKIFLLVELIPEKPPALLLLLLYIFCLY